MSLFKFFKRDKPVNEKSISLSTPKSNIAEILLTLIQDGEVSLFKFPYLQSFKARIYDLKHRHDLTLFTEYKTGTNKFERKYKYASHTLPDFELEKAIEIYKKINV